MIGFVASEVAPWSKTGGLADVGAALPRALAAAGVGPVCVVVPSYTRMELPVRSVAGWRVRIHRDGEVLVAFVVEPDLYERDGIYGAHGTAYASEWPDNGTRFATLCRAAVAVVPALLGGRPMAWHAHDWQAGLLPVLAPEPTVLTIHNAAYQGWVPADQVPELGADGTVSLLREGIQRAAAITTVSPTFAREITTPGGGFGLEGLLGDRGVQGIVNGIDNATWDPSTDAHLPATYGPDRWAIGKARCRQALLAELGLGWTPGDVVVGIVSRLAHQKGLDVVADVAPSLVDAGVRLAILGSGDGALEERLTALAAAHPGRIGVRIGFDEGLAHRLTAGVDAFLMPSRFEPCGLAQLHALRYGAVPVVHPVGGLADTVVEGETGLYIHRLDADGILAAIRDTVAAYRDRPRWEALVAAGMARDSSWGPSAAAYADLFRELASG